MKSRQEQHGAVEKGERVDVDEFSLLLSLWESVTRPLGMPRLIQGGLASPSGGLDPYIGMGSRYPNIATTRSDRKVHQLDLI